MKKQLSSTTIQSVQLMVAASLEALLHHKNSIKTLEDQSANIKNMMIAKQDELAIYSAKIPDINNISQARENILASISLGNVLPDVLKTHDQENLSKIEDHKQATHEFNLVKTEVNQAISGLQRKFNEVQLEINELNRQRRQMLIDHFALETSLAKEKYYQAAVQIKENWLKLYALSRLVKLHLKGENNFRDNLELNIPMVSFPSLNEIIGNHDLFTFFSSNGAFSRGEHVAAFDVLIGSVNAVGLDLTSEY